MRSYSRAQEGPIEGDLHGVASPGPGYLQSQLPEEPESPHRYPVEPRPRGRCRYDEAGVRLDVESPPARQPYSQPVRIADRRYSPAHLPAHGRRRAQPGRVFPSDDHVAQSTKNLNDDAIGAAQATPRAPEPSVGSGGERFAALTATRRNDCTTRTGPHTKTEAVNARAASVVRLERPLALGHGQHSSKFIDASRRHGSNIGENSGVHPQGGDGTTSSGLEPA